MELSFHAKAMSSSTAVSRRVNSLGFQIVAAPIGVLVVWLAATFIFMIANARDRVQSEVASSTAMARAMMESAVASLPEGLDPAEALNRLDRVAPHVRHVRIAVAPSPVEAERAADFAAHRSLTRKRRAGSSG